MSVWTHQNMGSQGLESLSLWGSPPVQDPFLSHVVPHVSLYCPCTLSSGVCWQHWPAVPSVALGPYAHMLPREGQQAQEPWNSD